MGSNVSFKPVITLKRRGDNEHIASFTKMVVKFSWESDVDLDLMVFYKTKSGESGGIFSIFFGVDGSGGCLERFPFIQIPGSQKPDDVMNSEIIKISSLSDMGQVYIIVLNYEDATDNKTSNFGKYNGQLTIQTDAGDNLEVPLDSDEIGHVCIICTLDNTSGNLKLINENRIISLDTFIKEIPGANLLLR